MNARIVLVLILTVLTAFAEARTFRWSNQGNYLTADPHAQNTIITTAINGHVYDRLVLRGKQVEIVPGLAVSWQQTSPRVWIFNLRKGVKWHDDSDFTADDVVFSIRRAQGPTSGYRIFASAAGVVRRIDDFTVEFTTPAPNPALLDMLAQVMIMNQAWAVKYKVQQAQDFVLDPSPQDVERLRRDPNIRIVEGPENTVYFLGMDQHRDELLYSSVKGRNPFKDVRVRRAIYQAIDMDAISRTVLRGFARPTAIVLTNPEAAGIPKEMDKRLAYDIDAARKLLAEAGYAAGFSVAMDCDSRLEKTCAALVVMLAKAGITVNIVMGLPAVYYAKIRKLDTSLCILGWVSSVDAIVMLQSVMHGRDDSNGDWNVGNFRDVKLDAAIDHARVELDPDKRRALFTEAIRILQDGVYTVPLYRRLAPWASRANVEVVHRPDMTLEARWVKMR